MVVRVIINGAEGKMGSLALLTLNAHPDFEVVAALGRRDNLAREIKEKKADIVIDLTRADCVYENTKTIIEAGVSAVIGTTGLLAEQIRTLNDRAQQNKIGGIIVPNFSIAAVLMMRFAAEAAKYLPDVEIIELHHPHKYDAPSGTAIKTAELIAQQRSPSSSVAQYHEAVPGALGGKYRDIPIHSVRLPGLLANQQVIFGSIGETLQISHNTIDRNCFMPGLVLCCQKVTHLTSLVYGLEHLL